MWHAMFWVNVHLCSTPDHLRIAVYNCKIVCIAALLAQSVVGRLQSEAVTISDGVFPEAYDIADLSVIGLISLTAQVL